MQVCCYEFHSCIFNLFFFASNRKIYGLDELERDLSESFTHGWEQRGIKLVIYSHDEIPLKKFARGYRNPIFPFMQIQSKGENVKSH